MDNKDKNNMDSLLQSIGGCGLFQIISCSIISTCAMPAYWSFYFMAYGKYSPGWRCLDNMTSPDYNQTQLHSNTSINVFITGSCDLFEICQNVEFNPEASTTTTEFGLICNRAWIASTILILVAAGSVVGLCIVGSIADKYGRKITIHSTLLVLAALNIVSIFSVSWEMYAVIDFLLGVGHSFFTINMILSTEFVTPNWRLLTSSIPNWALSVSLFSVAAMITKDWKMLRIIIACLSAIYFILYCFLPRSMRWLAVNDKQDELVKVVKRIAKVNRVKPPDDEFIKDLCISKSEKNKADSNITIISLFRKGFRKQTCIVGLCFLSLDTVYFALAYGISIMPGNIYENMIILSVSEIPANVFSVLTGNVTGRRKSVMFFTFLEFLGLICVGVLDLSVEGEKQAIGKLVAIVFSKLCLNAGWYVLATTTLELYPTTARSTINSFARLCTFSTGLIAPLIIPDDGSSYQYVFYFVLSGLTLFCCFIVYFLPETKGKVLMNTWNDRLIEEPKKPESDEKNQIV